MARADSQGDAEPLVIPASSPGNRNPRRTEIVRRCLLIILALLPAFYLFQLIAKYGVNVPYADEFTVAPLLEKAHNQTLTFSDLFRQHNEHRYVFTRLILIAFAQLARGDLRAEMFFSALLAGLSAINLWIILRRTIPGPLEKTLVLIFLVNLLLFSPVQAENWMWGFQFVLLFCNFLFTAGLVVATSSLGLGKKFALCLLIAFVATFSFGGGVLLWALTFPIALLTHSEMTLKSRMAWGAAWGSAGIVSIALYFFGYVKPPYHPTIAASHNPADYFLYVSTFLGAHLSRAARGEPMFRAAAVGTVLLAVLGFALVHAFRYRRDLDLRRRLLPWFALGGYALLNALLAAAARIGFGINQALDSRYTSFSLYLSIAAIGLFAILKRDLPSRIRSSRLTGAVIRVETILLTAFAFFSFSAFSWGRTFMVESQRTRLWGKGALLFSNVMDSGEIHDRYLMANAPEARDYANTLDRIGLLHPRMIPSAEISKLNMKDGGETGFIDIVSESRPLCSVVGWALLPKTRARPHCVVLSYDDPIRGPIAFRVADGISNRPDVATVRNDPAAEASGWSCNFDRSLLPPGDILLRAWAFDANRAILYPLGTPKTLP